MSRNWYENQNLTSRARIKAALQNTNGNQSAAAADLKCTAEQLRKAMDVYLIIPKSMKTTGTAEQLRLREMLRCENDIPTEEDT